MPLKKITFEEERKRVINSLEKTLLNAKMPYNFDTIFELIKRWNSVSYLLSSQIDENVENIYGKSDDKENDIDWKLAKLLFLYECFKHLYVGTIHLGGHDEDIKHKNLILKNTRAHLESHFPEYKINWDSKEDFIPLETQSTKTIIDNLNDLENEKADPIKALLQNFKSDNELIGCISKVYADLEKINPNEYNNLNEQDKSILRNSYKLSKQLVNNVDSAKGHKGESNLKIKDIAHNFALLVSLVYKLIKLNSKLKKCL